MTSKQRHSRRDRHAGEVDPHAVPHRRVRGKPSMQLYTLDQVAGILAVSKRTVTRWIDRGDLKACRFGAAVRISERDLAAFIAKHRR